MDIAERLFRRIRPKYKPDHGRLPPPQELSIIDRAPRREFRSNASSSSSLTFPTRCPNEQEQYYMEGFAGHVWNCPPCGDTLKYEKPHCTLCWNGLAWARDLTRLICPYNGVPISAVDERAPGRPIQVLLPQDCGSVNALIRALERGLDLAPSKEIRSVQLIDGGLQSTTSQLALTWPNSSGTSTSVQKFGQFEGFEEMTIAPDGFVRERSGNQIGRAQAYQPLFIGLTVDVNGYILNNDGLVVGSAVRWPGLHTVPGTERRGARRAYSMPIDFMPIGNDERQRLISITAGQHEAGRVFYPGWSAPQPPGPPAVLALPWTENSHGEETSTEDDIEPSFAVQQIQVWSDSLFRKIPTNALLDTGSMGSGANLVSEHFLRTLGIDHYENSSETSRRYLTTAGHDWHGLGGQVQTKGNVELKFFPIHRDNLKRKREGVPILLKFFVHDGFSRFGDILLGAEYCQEHEVQFHFSIKTKKKVAPDEQRSANDIMRERELLAQRVAEENARRGSANQNSSQIQSSDRMYRRPPDLQRRTTNPT